MKNYITTPLVLIVASFVSAFFATMVNSPGLTLWFCCASAGTACAAPVIGAVIWENS